MDYKKLLSESTLIIFLVTLFAYATAYLYEMSYYRIHGIFLPINNIKLSSFSTSFIVLLTGLSLFLFLYIVLKDFITKRIRYDFLAYRIIHTAQMFFLGILTLLFYVFFFYISQRQLSETLPDFVKAFIIIGIVASLGYFVYSIFRNLKLYNSPEDLAHFKEYINSPSADPFKLIFNKHSFQSLFLFFPLLLFIPMILADLEARSNTRFTVITTTNKSYKDVVIDVWNDYLLVRRFNSNTNKFEAGYRLEKLDNKQLQTVDLHPNY